MQKGILTITKQLSPIITVWTMDLDLLGFNMVFPLEKCPLQ